MASSTNLTARLVGGVFGVAILGALLPTGHSGHVDAYAFTSALHTGLYLCAAVAAAGAAMTAMFIRPNQPAPRPADARKCGPFPRRVAGSA
jgi:hypothetical protein